MGPATWASSWLTDASVRGKVREQQDHVLSRHMGVCWAAFERPRWRCANQTPERYRTACFCSYVGSSQPRRSQPAASSLHQAGKRTRSNESLFGRAPKAQRRRPYAPVGQRPSSVAAKFGWALPYLAGTPIANSDEGKCQPSGLFKAYEQESWGPLVWKSTCGPWVL